MGNGMNKIIPGLYVGSIRDAKIHDQLEENKISHILAIYDAAQPVFEDRKYLCIKATDTAQQDLIPYFSECNNFIHSARCQNGSVLVHCVAGISRSVTITCAYLMTLTGLDWRKCLSAVRGARRMANPNFGFQRQLLNFQHEGLAEERKRFKEQYQSFATEFEIEEIEKLIEAHDKWVETGNAKAISSLYSSAPDTYTDCDSNQSNSPENVS